MSRVPTTKRKGKAMTLVWGAYKGAAQHLFSGVACVQSECGKAYAGDRGIATPSKRKVCKLCEAIAKERGIDLPELVKIRKGESDDTE